MMRLWVRILAQRSSISCLMGPATVLVIMGYLTANRGVPGRGKSQGKPCPGNGSIVLGRKKHHGYGLKPTARQRKSRNPDKAPWPPRELPCTGEQDTLLGQKTDVILRQTNDEPKLETL